MADIPGMKPGWYVPGTAPQGALLNTPRNNNMAGGPQYYDPKYATVRAAPQVNQQLNGLQSSMARGYNGVKPGGGSGATGSPRGTVAGGGFVPTSVAGQTTPASPGGLFGNTPVFSPQDTARSEYTIRAGADRASNLPFVMKQFDRPGMSRGAGNVASAAAQIASTQSQGRENAANQFVDDYMTNQRFALDAQMARERERLGLGNVEARLQEMIQRQQLGQTGGLLQMLDF